MTNQNTPSDNFDQYMRTSVDQIKYPYNGNDWSTLQTMLNQHDEAQKEYNNSPRGLERWWKWLVGGLMVLLVGGYIILTNHDRSIHNTSFKSESDNAVHMSPNAEKELLSTVIVEESDRQAIVENKPNPENIESPSQLSRLTRRDAVPKLYAPPVKPVQYQSTTPLALKHMSKMRAEDLLQQLDSLQAEKRRKYLVW